MDKLDSLLIQKSLSNQTASVYRHWHIFERIDSTHQWLKNHLKSQTYSSWDGHVCLAEEQTQGIGRRGGHWHSPKQGNIYLTLALPLKQPTPLTGLPVALAIDTVLRLREVLKCTTLTMKWPNDLFDKTGKIGGILVELLTYNLPQKHAYALISLGLNLQKPQGNHITLTTYSVSSLKQLMAQNELSRTQLLAHLIETLTDTLQTVSHNSFKSYQKAFTQVDDFSQAPIKVIFTETPSVDYAISQGVNERGELTIRSLITGKVYDLITANVSLRKMPLCAFLVGGAVRDTLLEKPVKDRDWVVLGSTPETMLRLGFRAVGKDFPVFLHPETHEEYALARTERKISHGYQGFSFFSHPSITLEEDLIRRDLTINAMAQDEDGNIIDLFGGVTDLKNRILRHVSSAFVEDPLRVLRTARFGARYYSEGFRVAEETKQLLTEIACSGELNHLSLERIWQESEKALTTSHPAIYFQILATCQANKALWPKCALDIEKLSIVQGQTLDPVIRYVLLLHQQDMSLIEKAVPKQYEALRKLFYQHKLRFKEIILPEASEVLNFLTTTDALRKPERFQKLLHCCELYYASSEAKKRAQILLALSTTLATLKITINPSDKTSPATQAYQQKLNFLQSLCSKIH